MTKIQLIRLKLINFKGIHSYELTPDGHDLDVMGRNASGKSTLFDAFTWLLFGKDSHGATNFQVKPRDADGAEVIGAEPVVEGIIDVDGTYHVTLRRELKENWVKHRGEVEAERKSDTTKLFIDAVPTKLKDYQAYISELIPEDLFKLLTVPGAFNALKVDERRQILMGLAGDVDDSEVIASNSHLSKLQDVLGKHSIADQKKTVAYQRKELKKRIEIIPSLVSEAERAKPQLDAPKEQLEAILKDYQQKADATSAAIAEESSASDDTKRRQQIADLQVKMTDAKNRHQLKISADGMKLRQAKAEAQDKYDAVLSQSNSLTRATERLDNDLAVETTRHDNLLKRYYEKADVAFEESATECPTCHQQLPDDQVDKLREDFNVTKSNDLESLIKEGKESAVKVTDLTGQLSDTKQQLTELEPKLAGAQEALTSAETTLNNHLDNAPRFEQTPEYADLVAQIDLLRQEDKPADNTHLTELKTTLATQQAGVDRTREQLAKYDQVAKQEARKQELVEEETSLKQQAAELDEQDYLLQEFTHTKSTMLETRLNGLFKVVVFQLFDTQKDGTVVDVVKTTVGGVDYDAGLNTGARLRAGLDIINVLDRNHEVQAPIFVDNAEGLTDEFTTDAQQIRLHATQDETLKVEG